MSLYLNKNTQISRTYEYKKFKINYKPWKWIDGEWVKEPNLEPVLDSRFESRSKSYIVEVSK